MTNDVFEWPMMEYIVIPKVCKFTIGLNYQRRVWMTNDGILSPKGFTCEVQKSSFLIVKLLQSTNLQIETWFSAQWNLPCYLQTALRCHFTWSLAISLDSKVLNTSIILPIQIWPTLSGHQEHEYSHTRCCCSARSARYRCGSCSFYNYTMHCICKFLPPPQGRFSRFPLLPCNFLR